MADRVDAELSLLLGTIDGADTVSEETVRHLGRMLQGFELFLGSDGQEPYLEIYYAAVERDCLEKLAQVAAALLRLWLAGNWKPRLEKRAHFNLLGLCMEVHQRRCLAEPIWEIYKRRQEKLVWGEYDVTKPVPLVQALLDAMIRNQEDGPEPMTLWQSLLDGVSDGYLVGGPLDGFVGMLYLPESGSEEDRVALLSEGLRKLFWMNEERFFISALSLMRRAVPYLAELVDVETRKRIREDFLTVIELPRIQVIDPEIDWAVSEGCHEEARTIATKWKNVKEKFIDHLSRAQMTGIFRTKIQIYNLYIELINIEFYTRDNFRDRKIWLKLRALETPWRPNPARPNQPFIGAVISASPIESIDDLVGLYANK